MYFPKDLHQMEYTVHSYLLRKGDAPRCIHCNGFFTVTVITFSTRVSLILVIFVLDYIRLTGKDSLPLLHQAQSFIITVIQTFTNSLICNII